MHCYSVFSSQLLFFNDVAEGARQGKAFILPTATPQLKTIAESLYYTGEQGWNFSNIKLVANQSKIN